MFEEITTEQKLKDQGLDKVAEFYNYYITEIKKGNITKKDIKAKHNVTIGGISAYLKDNNYVLKNNHFVKGEVKEVSLSTNDIIKLKKFLDFQFSEDDLYTLKHIIQNGLEDFRDPYHLELIRKGTSKEKKQELFKFSPDVDNEFNDYCMTHKLFNKSEHVMLALLEYMDKYN